MVTNGLRPTNFKEWLWSAKVLTTIIWIIFPLCYITATEILFELGLYPPEVLVEGPSLYLSDIHTISTPPITYMAVLFLFSVYPAIYTTEIFFKKRGSANVVIEYPYIRKILFAYVIVLIVLIIGYFLTINPTNELIKKNTEHLINRGELDSSLSSQIDTLLFIQSLSRGIVFIWLPPVLIFILLKLLLEQPRKRFEFYYAKACFEIVMKIKYEPDKAEYLLRGLDWYNKFVKKVTKGSIDIETIYSKIISHSQLSNNIVLDIISDSFHGGDELNPLRHMLALLSSWKEGDATLVKESLRARIKESSDLLIPIVTVIITILTTFILKPPPTPGT